MSLIDVKCQACNRVDEVYRSIADWPKTPTCSQCGADTVQIHLPKRTQWQADPIIVFKAPDGTYRFPGDGNGLTAAHYRKEGFERVELRGVGEMRSFEKRMNTDEYSRAMRKAEAYQAHREASESERRSELRSRMAGMSASGRDLARAAMAMNDGKPREYAKETGFHAEVYSVDRSNRDESRDSQGRRRRD